MIRAHEKLIAWRAGIFSVLVHGVLLAILLISVNWKAEQPLSVAEVELWDSLPTDKPVPKPPVAKPIPPEPEPKPEPKPETKPLPPEPEPEPEPEPKAEIQVEKKPDPAIKAREEALKRKQEQKRKDEEKLKLEQKRIAEEKRKAEEKRQLEELQKMIAEENREIQQERQQAQAAAASAATAAANKGEVDKYAALISNKIRGYVNPQLCGANKVDLKFQLALLPTGELAGNPRLLKSSGIAVCDQAVERAIRQAQPLPLPTDPDIRARFRDIAITFYPN